MTQLPYKAIETPKVFEAVFAVFFTERMNVNVCRQRMLAFNETDDMNHFAVLSKLLYPSMKETENRMVLIDGLGAD